MRVEKRHKGRVPHEQPRGMIRETKRLKRNKGGELDEGAGLWWSAEECVCAAVAEGRGNNGTLNTQKHTGEAALRTLRSAGM